MKSVKRLLEISNKVNIAKDLNEDRLTEIANLCVAAYELDQGTCDDRFKELDKFVDMAKLTPEKKTYPWDGAANAKYPMMTTAAMQFNARAFPAMVTDGKIVKTRVFGKDLDNSKADRGDRIANHMSYQLRYGMDSWVEDMDSLLLRIPIVGHLFKKMYYDPVAQKPNSPLLTPQQLVVNNDTTLDLDSCPCITEVLERMPQQIKTNMDIGIWLDEDISYEDEDNEAPETILEQHRLMDVYEDGNKEPYIITLHKESNTVLRIKACFDQDTIHIDLNGEFRPVGEIIRSIEAQNITIRKKNMEAAQIAEQANATIQQSGPAIQTPEIPPFDPKMFKAAFIKKIQYYVDYWYLPSFNGKFYKAGLADLLVAVSELVDTNLNQMLDAGTLSNLQGGFKLRTGKMKSGIFASKPGEYIDVDTAGLPIRDAIMPFNFKGPSPVLFNLLGMLIDSSRDISNVKDIMMGEAPAGETATTTMIKREEGMKVFSAIYLRLYRSLSREFRCLYDLNRKYLKQEEYFRYGDTESHVSKEDYEDDKIDVIPVADAKESSTTDKLLKAQELMQFMQDPDANQVEIKKNYLSAVGFDPLDFEKFFPPKEPAPPGPEYDKLVAETAKLNAEAAKLVEERILVRTKAVEALANAEAKEEGTQLNIYKQALEEMMHDEESKRRGAEGMANEPNNTVGPKNQTKGTPGG